MDFQTIIAAIIVLAALAYVGRTIWLKTKSFSPGKSGCASDCGCSSGSVKRKT